MVIWNLRCALSNRAHSPTGHTLQQGTLSNRARSPTGHALQQGTLSNRAHSPPGHTLHRGTLSNRAHFPCTGAHSPPGHVASRGNGILNRQNFRSKLNYCETKLALFIRAGSISTMCQHRIKYTTLQCPDTFPKY